MSVIIFSGRGYTGTGQLAQKAADIWGYRVVYDRDLIKAAALESGLGKNEIEKSVYNDPPIGDRFSPGKARCIAAVKSILAREVEKGRVIFSGFLGELVPPEMGLHILVTASDNFRVRRLRDGEGNGGAKVPDRIRQADEAFLRWALYLKDAENRQPGDYDGVVNVSRTGQSELIRLISEAAEKKQWEIRPGEFFMAAEVSRIMAENGHQVAVSARGDAVDLRVIKPVWMLSRYGKKLSALARSVKGVKQVRTGTAPRFYRADILSGLEFVPAERIASRPLEREYDQLYARVADCHPSFLNRQNREVAALVCPRPVA